MKFSQIHYSDVDFNDLDRFDDRTIFQTKEWLDFLADAVHATPVIAELRGDGRLGYFTGAVVRKFGFRILGSPFPGWTTAYMGFNLLPGVPRREALAALEAFALRELRCAHLELMDDRLSFEDGRSLGFSVRAFSGYRSDLTPSENAIFAGMTGACRRCIRKSEKSGVTIEEADDDDFAGEYYDRLKDVFGKQGLAPTYDLARVRQLIKHLQPTGRLLLLRARNAEGRCIATGIYPGMNRLSYFWGNASYRKDQGVRPNEALHWYAMRYWKSRGIRWHDWGGTADYKKKYGGSDITIPWFFKSKNRFVLYARNAAYQMYRMPERCAERFNRLSRNFSRFAGSSRTDRV